MPTALLLQHPPVGDGLELLDDVCEDPASFLASDSYENTLAPDTA